MVAVAHVLVGAALWASALATTCPSGDDGATTKSCKARGADSALLQREGFVSRVLANLVKQEEPELLMRLPSKGPDHGITMQWDPNRTHHLPLCHPLLVKDACDALGGIDGAVAFDKVRTALSASEQDAGMLWKELGLEILGAPVPCSDLCTTLTHYVRSVGGVLPPASNLACYTLNGVTNCDIDVEPKHLVGEMATAEVVQEPDVGKDVVGDEVQIPEVASAQALEARLNLVQSSLVRKGAGDMRIQRRAIARDTVSSHPETITIERGTNGTTCPYTLWAFVERLANTFRIFPSNGQDTPISMPEGATLLQGAASVEAAVAEAIAGSNAQAKAWMATVLSEMQGNRTAAFRSTWFGGIGPMDEYQVRDRVLMTMNFVGRELIDGIHYVYPADEATDSSCGGNAIAYVWKWLSNEDGYVETSGPVCGASVDVFATHCGIDPEGRYYVYLCRLWFDGIRVNNQISTLVHEAAHHSGPRDVTYDRATMKAMSQSDQLHNAANYQNFAQDVAQSAWGCPDNPVVTDLPFTCSPSPCTCMAFRDMCDDVTFGEKITAQCPATCGKCTGPVNGSQDTTLATTEPATTTETTSPSTTAATTASTTTPSAASSTTTESSTTISTSEPWSKGGCCEPQVAVSVKIGSSTYSGSCSAFMSGGFCTEQAVSAKCPISCKFCVPPGCEDDPTFAIATSVGMLTCQDWQNYVCWDNVKSHCPSACKVGGCR